MEQKREDILKSLLDFLRDYQISEEDIKKGRKYSHDPLITKMSNKIGELTGVFIWQPGERFIDVMVRRSNFANDRILLAAEVERDWHLPFKNWTKLLDIKADIRVWVYLTFRTEAKELFKESINKMRQLIKHRQENLQEIAPLIFVLKTPDLFDYCNITQIAKEE